MLNWLLKEDILVVRNGSYSIMQSADNKNNDTARHKKHLQFNPYLGVNFLQTMSNENIKNALSKRVSSHCAGSCISYFSVYNNCVEFSASGLGTGLNRVPFKAETTYSHDPSLTSHLSLGLIHPCTITTLSMCSS